MLAAARDGMQIGSSAKEPAWSPLIRVAAWWNWQTDD